MGDIYYFRHAPLTLTCFLSTVDLARNSQRMLLGFFCGRIVSRGETCALQTKSFFMKLGRTGRTEVSAREVLSSQTLLFGQSVAPRCAFREHVEWAKRRTFFTKLGRTEPMTLLFDRIRPNGTAPAVE